MEQQTSQVPSQPLDTAPSTKSNLPLIIGGIVLLLLVAMGSYILGSRSAKISQNTIVVSPTEAPQVTPTDSIVNPTITEAMTTLSPVQKTNDFYKAYNKCIAESDANGSNYGGKSRIEICGEQYKQYLTPSMYTILKSYYSRPDDPFLCSQAYYAEIRVKNGDINEEKRANTIVIASFQANTQPRNTTVNLVKVNNQWLINDIVCPKP